MKDRSIIMLDSMIKATLSGAKTQLRVPVKFAHFSTQSRSDRQVAVSVLGDKVYCPLGQVGDRLWVRETFCLETSVDGVDQPFPFNDGRPVQYLSDGIACKSRSFADQWLMPHYKATDQTPELRYEDTDGEPTVRWKSPVAMPRWASRIVLSIACIDVQRLRSMTEQDATAEGVPGGGCKHCGNPVPCGCAAPLPNRLDAFYYFWDSLYAAEGFECQKDPLMWVVTFERA